MSFFTSYSRSDSRFHPISYFRLIETSPPSHVWKSRDRNSSVRVASSPDTEYACCPAQAIAMRMSPFSSFSGVNERKGSVMKRLGGSEVQLIVADIVKKKVK